MTKSPQLVSIVITNHNYASFVADSVRSALEQDYPHREVIVVDDGSKDESLEILREFADSIQLVRLDGRGQAAALNAGVARTRGDVVCLLDADDMFLTWKTSSIVHQHGHRLGDGVLICHPLTPVDADGRRLPGREPVDSRGEWAGNLYELARRDLYLPYAGAPTSGLVIDRALVSMLFPLKTTTGVKHGADDLIVRGASLVGDVVWIDEELSLYRHHGPNAFGRGRPRSRAFHLNEEAFLNERLVAAGKQPVIDFFGSEYARGFLLQHGARREMVALAWHVVRRNPGLGSLAFSVRTVLMAAFPAVAPRSEREQRAVARRHQATTGG